MFRCKFIGFLGISQSHASEFLKINGFLGFSEILHRISAKKYAIFVNSRENNFYLNWWRPSWPPPRRSSSKASSARHGKPRTPLQAPARWHRCVGPHCGALGVGFPPPTSDTPGRTREEESHCAPPFAVAFLPQPSSSGWRRLLLKPSSVPRPARSSMHRT